MYIHWSCNGDRYTSHEKRAAERALESGTKPPGLDANHNGELIAGDGRIVGYLRDGEPPERAAEIAAQNEVELAGLRRERQAEELAELRAWKAAKEAAARAAVAPPPGA